MMDLSPINVEKPRTPEQVAHEIEIARVLAHIETSARLRKVHEVTRWASELARLQRRLEVVTV